MPTEHSLAAPPAPRTLNVALIGNPNTGKSTLFNALAGMNARIGNYPGVTVEKKIGRMLWAEQTFHLIDLPGTYSLSPRSLDEMISIDVLLGRVPSVGKIDAIVCIADAANLERHLYLVSQLLELKVPVVLVLNLWDTVAKRGVTVDVDKLREKLQIPIVVTEAHRKRGLEEVKTAIVRAVETPPREVPRIFPEAFYQQCTQLENELKALGQENVPRYMTERMVLDVHGSVESRYVSRVSPELQSKLEGIRGQLRDAGCPVPGIESQVRYQWIKSVTSDVITRSTQRVHTVTDSVDKVLTHRVFGLLLFAALMFLVFQSIYTWSGPFMDWTEAAQGWVADRVIAVIAPGAFRSLLVDGVIAGVGGVLVFLPQIIMLFFFIALMEDCGYMARAAYMVDRVMSWFGLSGKSFLPLMSSFACAIPGIMATRVIEHRRERMVTILIAPLMSCSARLPVYLLLISAFIPATTYLSGWVSLQGLVLFAMTSLGLLLAVPLAWVLKKLFFPGEAAPFVMELPEYKMPSAWVVTARVYDRGKAFVVRAGTLIFAATVVIWALGYFPEDHTEENRMQAQIEELESEENLSEEQEAELEALQKSQNAESARLIEDSYLGQMGHVAEPVFRPLGWDWKISVGAIASFPAREVIIATLGTIYSLGGDVDEEDEGLQASMKAARHRDGSLVYNIPVALSIMVFFALCAQCAATLMVIRRETNSWRWPIFSFTYMTVLAWLGGFAAYQIGMRFFS